MNFRKLFITLFLVFALTVPCLALASLGDVPAVGDQLGSQSGVVINPVASPDGTFGGWILANLSWIIPTFLLLLDNLFKITPSKWIKSDDLIVTSGKAGAGAVLAGLRKVGIVKKTE